MKTMDVFHMVSMPLLRKGLTTLLNETIDMNWVGDAIVDNEAEAKIFSIRPDVIIVDIDINDLNTMEFVERLIHHSCQYGVVLIGETWSSAYITRAIRRGINGFLKYQNTEQQILTCIRSVYNSRLYVTPELTHEVYQQRQDLQGIVNRLSNRQINIVKLIADQKSTDEIAQLLHISAKTVSNHRFNICKKLDLSGKQNSLLKWAIAHSELLVAV